MCCWKCNALTDRGTLSTHIMSIRSSLACAIKDLSLALDLLLPVKVNRTRLDGPVEASVRFWKVTQLAAA